MIRFCDWQIGLMFLVGSTVAFGQGQQVPAPTAGVSMMQVVTVDYRNEPLKQVFQHLAGLTGRDVVVSRRDLEAAGVVGDMPVSLQLTNVPAAVVWRLLLAQVQSPADPLFVLVKPTYVKVTTRSVLDRRPVVRVYSVADLLMSLPKFANAPQMDLNAMLNGGDGGSLLSQVPADPQVTLSRDERAEALMQLIRDTVYPDIWQANGGTAGSIRYFNGNLIVRAPIYVQGQLTGDDQSPTLLFADARPALGPVLVPLPQQAAPRTFFVQSPAGQQVKTVTPLAVQGRVGGGRPAALQVTAPRQVTRTRLGGRSVLIRSQTPKR